MTDLSSTIAPKSDQLNADDLIAGPKTVRVMKVSACAGSADQPIAIYFKGDNNKPYKPCKSMRRVLFQVWGRDGDAYVGREMTLFRDANVQFGGIAVGGIRISHMSHIEEPITLALTATRASRKLYTVQPLKSSVDGDASGDDGNGMSTDEKVAALKTLLKSSPTIEKLEARWSQPKAQALRIQLSGDVLTDLENTYSALHDELPERPR